MVRLDIQHDLPARAVKRFDDAPVAHQDGIQELRSHRGRSVSPVISSTVAWKSVFSNKG